MSAKKTRLISNIRIAIQMAKRSIEEKYQGSVFGLLWSFLTPMLMLSVYTFVFSSILPIKWAQSGQTFDTVSFAIILFYGLSIHTFFTEVVTQSTTIITSNSIYIKKILFPVGILPITVTATALFQLLITLFLTVLFQFFFLGGLGWQSLLGIIILLPCIPLAIGMALFLSSFGAYFRDLQQVAAPLMTALLFLGPVLYPLSAVPERIRKFVYLNPVTFPAEELRAVLIWGETIDWFGLLIYSLVSLASLIIGYFTFNVLRAGFSDVI
ncbi:MAG: ABC transporter permease [Pseudomonadota bacterium]